MFRIFVIVFLVFAFVSFKCYQLLTYYPEIPAISETWWSDKDPLNEDENIYPFTINVTQEVLDDLNYRLSHTRSFTKPLMDNQLYGFNGEVAREINNYWITKYNWKEREKSINKYPHFITSIQGLNVHFLHFKPQSQPSNKIILPLLITHGWPSSFVEFLQVIPTLTTPQKDRNFVFEVVFATIPGFGFSQPPQKPGFGAMEAAVIFKNLMSRLNHHRFYVSGGDLGMIVFKLMAAMYPDAVMGMHSSMCVSLHPYSLLKYALGSIYPYWMVPEATREFLYPIYKFLGTLWTESGYLHLQSTKPDTYGFAVDDSPMGMAVQYLEKFSTGASMQNRLRQDGGLNKTYNIDDLLDNIMTFWITKSATTSYRFYAEVFTGYNAAIAIFTPVKAPSACSRAPQDITSPDGILEETFQNVVYSKDYSYGHFAAYENPEMIADVIYESFDKIEKFNRGKSQILEEKTDL